MESIGKNPNGLCRLAQPIKLQPHRQYKISFWVKTENLSPANPEVKVLTPGGQGSVSFESFHAARTQDWKQYHLVFNSMDETEGRIYLGVWGGKEGRLWWDDLTVDEIGLVNVLRRPGCPFTVQGFTEGKDYEPVVDPKLGQNPWKGEYRAWHDPVAIKT